MLDWGFFVGLACAMFYYRVAEAERLDPVILCGASIALWLLTSFGLHWGLVASLGVQAGIFVALTLRNMSRPPRA